MKLIDTNRHYLKGTNDRFLHLATVQMGVREFICFADLLTRKPPYIEEVTGGHLEFIEDEQLAKALEDFLRYHKVLSMTKPLLPDAEWYRRTST
jgi:hypothetical protein